MNSDSNHLSYVQTMCEISKFKSGGSGGSIREAGGAFGKMEAAREEEYFHKLKQAQLKALKDQATRDVCWGEYSRLLIPENGNSGRAPRGAGQAC
jgi:hypothetical protein